MKEKVPKEKTKKRCLKQQKFEMRERKTNLKIKLLDLVFRKSLVTSWRISREPLDKEPRLLLKVKE